MGIGGIGLLPVFVVGLLGSVHCAGMCGGIVGALSVAPVTLHAARPARPALANGLAYNAGRIGSYMLAAARLVAGRGIQHPRGVVGLVTQGGRRIAHGE